MTVRGLVAITSRAQGQSCEIVFPLHQSGILNVSGSSNEASDALILNLDIMLLARHGQDSRISAAKGGNI